MAINDLGLTALSVAKWNNIVFRGAIDMGVNDCPLCKKYYNPTEPTERCIGCPIQKITNEINCLKTPYTKWASYCYGSCYTKLMGVFDSTAKEFAIEEIKFLLKVIKNEWYNANRIQEADEWKVEDFKYVSEYGLVSNPLSKRRLAEKCIPKCITYDYAIPQKWLDKFSEFSIYSYDFILGTTFTLYCSERKMFGWIWSAIPKINQEIKTFIFDPYSNP